MRLCSITRLFVAAGTVLLAAPAFGQATVSASLSAGNPATDADIMSLGVAKTFTLTVSNAAGSTHVTSFDLNATLTPPAAPYTAKVGAITGCAPIGVCKGGTNASEACTVLADCPDQTAGTACFTGLCKGGTNANEACNALANCPDQTAGTACTHPVIPCRVKLASPLLAGGTTKVSIPVTVPAPNPLPTAPAECPSQLEAAVAGSGSTNATVSLTRISQGSTVVDPNTRTATLTTRPAPLNDFNDLAVTDLTAPANASEGQNIQYSVTVHNYGPCPGTNTFSDFFPTGTLGFASATGCDNNSTLGQDGGCDLSSTPFAPGSNRTYTATWTVLTFPKSVIKATMPVSVDVVADEDLVNGPDPDAPDHSPSAEVVTTVDLSKNDTLCSMGGSGTLLSLLSLLALRFARRRAS